MKRPFWEDSLLLALLPLSRFFKCESRTTDKYQAAHDLQEQIGRANSYVRTKHEH